LSGQNAPNGREGKEREGRKREERASHTAAALRLTKPRAGSAHMHPMYVACILVIIIIIIIIIHL